MTTAPSPLPAPVGGTGADRWAVDRTGRPRRGARALVLGGGGSTGNAWLIGVVAGLHEAGVDVTDADLVVGTSAGATAAAQLTGASPAELLNAALRPGPAPASARLGTGDSSGPPVSSHLQRVRGVIAAADDAADMRRRMGAATLQAESAADGSWQARWRATVATRLPGQHWPRRRLLLTAVNARTGDPVAFDARAGVELVDAVAASCSSGVGAPPYRIGDEPYIDGGYRRNENADLAAGCERVLVLSPLGGRSLHPPEWGMQLSAQVDELRARGSRVETVVPDPASEHLFGAPAMDLSLRPAAARAGHDRGVLLAESLGPFWRADLTG